MSYRTKAVIFDMDGTLVNTDAVTPELEKNMLKDLGVPYTDEFEKEISGLSIRELYSLIQKKYVPDFSVEKANKAYADLAKTVYQERSSLMPGAKELIFLLQRKHIPMAIASAAPKEWIDMFVKRFEFEETFQHLLSIHSMQLPSKPNPAIFNEAIQLLNVEPQDTVIFEDTARGVQAGKMAGARVVAVPDKRWSFGDFSSADLVANTLQDPNIIPFLFS
ncbi:MAG: HAD family phosphatase [Candidatus Wildermuthbacteria bacterium]|nr:HAD family phosphatase [Candidatus Wildermuthbacteria bacterium]